MHKSNRQRLAPPSQPKNKRLPYGEEIFISDIHLHEWWNSVVNDSRFVDVIAAMKRRNPHRGPIADNAVFIAGFKEGFNDFADRLAVICQDVKQSSEETFQQITDPDLENHG